MIKKIFNYLGLYRLDVATLAMVGFLAGVLLAGGDITPNNLTIAFLISLISMNFIYSFNSYADREIDAINKPWRPIPSGKILPKNALCYCSFLLLASLIYPLFCVSSLVTAVFFYLLPLLGLFYSGKFLRLKKYIFPALITITLMHHSPFLLGYFLTTNSLRYLPVFISTFFFCLAVIPLKDLTDVKGDIKYGSQNWLAKFGQKNLLLFSLSILIFNIALIFFFSLPLIYKVALLIFNLIPVFLIWLAKLQKQLIYVYKRIIAAVIVEGVVFILFLMSNGKILAG